jgi:plastocyanin
MKRSILSLISVLTFCGIGLIASSATAIDGPQANATISFGQRQTDHVPPLDRITTPDLAMGAGVNDELIPDIVTIKAGGSVNFIIAGLHNPTVYDVGTQPDDISTASPLPGAAGGIINDPNHRLYRGLDPNVATNPRDRVEVVQFAKPGTYLVICGVFNHFVNSHMFGFVKVLPGSEK